MASKQLPTTLRQLLVEKLTTNFREATKIVEKPIPNLGPKEVLVKNRFVGINASDVNFSAGRYFQTASPPFPVGFEGLGEVVSTGPEVAIKVGQYVAYSKFGAFCDYIVVAEDKAIPVPSCDPAFMAFLVSGLTASISLDKEADLKTGKTVLVTAAAGGTGQFAVQLAKQAGCHVIGTCSSEEKATFLKDIGCDRTVNYKQEDLGQVLAKEYEKGIDVVYESIGKDIFFTALKNLAVFGRLIVIGQISTYHDVNSGGLTETETKTPVSIPMSLLGRSASLRGFFLMNYFDEAPAHMMKLVGLYTAGKLKVSIDQGQNASTGPFVGLDKVADAVEYLYARGNVGKIVVEMNAEGRSTL